MATFNGTSANNTFIGTTANDVFNYGNVTYSGLTIVGARGFDTISSGGGFDTLNLGNLGLDHIGNERVGNDFVVQIYPTADWDESNPQAAVGGVTIKNFFAADGNGVIDRANFAEGYASLSYQAGVFRANLYSLADVLVETSVTGTPGNDSLVGTEAVDLLDGEAGNDTLVGLGGSDELEGGSGNDRIDGGLGNDELFGQAGNDTLIPGPGNDTLWGDDTGDVGIDTADYGFANGSIEVDLGLGWAKNGGAPSGNSTNVGFDLLNGIERVVGSGFADLLAGNDAANTLSGGSGNDSISGGAGNDSLLGGAGSDWFDASLGDPDHPDAGRGNDTIDGGAITDLINYSDANTISFGTNSVRVNLQSGTASDGFGGADTLRNINFVKCLGGNDTLTGSTKLWFESFKGDAGDDVIDGGAIADTLEFRDSNRADFYGGASVTVDLRAGTASGQGNDRLTNINGVRGSHASDLLYGSNSTVVIETFEGMEGDDLIDGRGGVDVVRYDYARGESSSGPIGVNVNLATGIGRASTQDEDALAHIEGVSGSHYGDTLTGGNADSAALEFFCGNGGSDRIDGGAGYDRVDYVNSVQGVSVQLGGTAAGTAKDGLPTWAGVILLPGAAGAVIGTDTLLRIEAVRGSDFADTLRGSGIASEETFEGRGGNDQIDGGAGPDRASYHAAGAGVTVKLGLAGAAGSATDGLGSTDTLRNIENVQGSRDFADRITGNELANRLDGQGGNDTLVGGGGNDTLVGGAGNDSYVVDSSTDVISETTTVATEIDSVSSNVTWTLGANLERLTLTGSGTINGTGNSLANTITGNTGNNSLSGSSGHDSLIGGGGNDTLVGGTGNDSYTIDSSTDVISETTTVATEIDSVSSNVTWTLGVNLERLTLTGSGTINGTGNSLANTITGNTGNNSLSGSSGHDSLIGGGGNDTLVGGTGNDSYTVDSSTDVISETTTVATEIDSVSSNVTWTLRANLERLTLTGSGTINGTGNSLANTITGNTGNNSLSGSSGNDTINGGSGNDMLNGGTGLDTFRFSSALASSNVDTVSSFVPADDAVQLENSVFLKLPTTGALGSSFFRANATGTAADSNDYIVYETDTGKLFYDADGSGAGTAVLFATLTGAPTLTSADIFVT